jgi:hypothetical protein
MNFSNWISLVAFVVASVSAVLTIRVYQRGIQIETYTRTTELFLKLNEVFISHPEARPYFYESSELGDEDDANLASRVRMIAEHMLDIFDWVLHDCEGASDTDQESWRAYVGEMFNTSPILAGYHLAHPDWHPVLHAEIVRQGKEWVVQEGVV